MTARKEDDAGSADSANASTLVSSPDLDAPDAARSRPSALVGRIIAERYRVLALLGEGGMGSVYTCEHIQLQKRVALKVLADSLRNDPELAQRFLKEARAAAQIGHPNIVDVFDLGELPEGGAYIAMELLEGRDLDVEIKETGAMPAPRACVIVAEICRALAAAHGKGIVHRDMKPANVFLASAPDRLDQVKVLDFGVAQVQEGTGNAPPLTRAGAIVGTPTFMSPEQARGERADNRTDIYAVGCILYALLTGDAPFEASTVMGLITKHLFEQPQPPSQRRPDLSISADLDALVLRAMAKQPEARFQTMKEMWTALDALSDSPTTWPDISSGRFPVLPPSDSAVMAVKRSAIAPPSRRLAIPIALVVAAFAIGLGAVTLLHKPPAPPVAASPPTSNDVSVDVRTVPEGASVWDGAKELGTTPLHMVRRRSDETLALRISTDGCNDESVSVPLDHDRLVDIRLRPDVH